MHFSAIAGSFNSSRLTQLFSEQLRYIYGEPSLGGNLQYPERFVLAIHDNRFLLFCSWSESDRPTVIPDGYGRWDDHISLKWCAPHHVLGRKLLYSASNICTTPIWSLALKFAEEKCAFISSLRNSACRTYAVNKNSRLQLTYLLRCDLLPSAKGRTMYCIRNP